MNALRHYGRVLCFLFLFLPVPDFHAHSETLVIDSDAQFSFAQACFIDKHYAQAANEFKRFLYFFPKDSRVITARFRLGMSYFHTRQFPSAAATFEQIIQQEIHGETADRSRLMVVECRLGQNDIGAAMSGLQNIIQTSKDPVIQDDARYRLGWLWVETASWENATRVFHQVSRDGQKKYHLEAALAELETVGNLQKKDPRSAGILSILPGAGHLYCDRAHDAAIALLVNAALIGSAWEAFDQDLPWLGGVICLLEIGVFSGTAYSAVNSAHKYNRLIDKTFINNLKYRFSPGVSIGPAPGGFHISLNFNY